MADIPVLIIDPADLKTKEMDSILSNTYAQNLSEDEKQVREELYSRSKHNPVEYKGNKMLLVRFETNHFTRLVQVWLEKYNIEYTSFIW